MLQTWPRDSRRKGGILFFLLQHKIVKLDGQKHVCQVISRWSSHFQWEQQGPYIAAVLKARKGWMKVDYLRSHLCGVICFRCERSLAVVTIKVHHFWWQKYVRFSLSCHFIIYLLPNNLYVCTKCVCLTFNRVSGQPQLADDVPRNVSFHQVTLLGVILCCLQQMVELLRIKLLETRALRLNMMSLSGKFWSWSINIELMTLKNDSVGWLSFCLRNCFQISRLECESENVSISE